MADYLLALVEDRAQRALLRRNVPGRKAANFDVYRLLGRFLPELEDRHRERCILLAAYVAAAFPSCWTTDDLSVGAGARPKEGEPDSESFSKRFTTLLESNFDQLEQRLPQFLSLLEHKRRQANLARLIRDLLRWTSHQHPVQRRWARDFFTEMKPPKESTAQ